MIPILLLLIGVVLAGLILANLPKIPGTPLRAAAAAGAVLLVVLFAYLGSFRHVGDDQIGVVIKNALGPELPPGRIIATGSQMGPQAEILGPGWHSGLWPVIFSVEFHPVLEITEGNVGLLQASDGQSLPEGEIYAPLWSEQEFQEMLTAEYFLGPGGGYKGPQASVLTPGKYRINPKLFSLETRPAVNVHKATVGVVKSNVGQVPPGLEAGEEPVLVERGQRGIWNEPLVPQIYYLNTNALEVTPISTAKQVVRYTKAAQEGEEREIMVRSSDGFTFPVDVRVEYEIKPRDAPLVVVNFSDDGPMLAERLNSAVRAIFRNNAERVKALDYVQQRSDQESQSLEMLSREMTKVGVSVTAVRIGDVGDEKTLGPLLKTQTDREIAIQEQKTFQEQQRTAEQQKELSRTQQEAEEERRLATAAYEVDIADKQKEQRIIEAEAEAESIRIRAEAQAEAFRVVAREIGQGNAALIEVLKIIGERGIGITPRVMVSGAQQETDGQTTALIGTMLDTMIRDREQPDEAGEPSN